MDPDRKPKVFRLRHLPNDANKAQALVYLSTGLGNIPIDSIHICSLATSLSPWRPTKTATLMFNALPALIQGDPSKDEWQIKVNGLEEPLILDTHFRGLTPLREPAPGHSFDCIALSGLSSHPFGSWQPKKTDKTFMWIRDALPLDLPQIRPILYGYETTLPESRSFQTITDLASQLINQLQSYGWTGLGAKPLVFLAHSLGGLVLKRAIVALANSGYDDSALRIAGGIFFGVPNFGMDQSSFLSIAKGSPNEMLVEDLSPQSSWLKGLELQFNGISYLRKIKIFWGYETCTSPTLIKGENGKILPGPDVVLVTRESATRGLVEIDESQTFPLNENHSNIVKFTRGHEHYGVVLRKLAHICGLDFSNENDTLEEIDEIHPNNLNRDHIEANGQGQHMARGINPSHIGKSQNNQQRSPLHSKQMEVLLKSLEVPARDERIQGIETHFLHTFDWIFKNPECGFVDWLQYGRGAFWINGSPGSGKSTLMKYIFQHRHTRELLHDVRNLREEVYAGFFFHYRGSEIQKSFDGLLRSILSQFLEQSSEIGTILFPLLSIEKDGCDKVIIKAPDWSRIMVEEAFTMILKQQQFNLDIFLFLDALDEYHGLPEFVAGFVESLIKNEKTSMTRLKVCFSSRPWDAFTTRFKSYAGINIQDFTEDDIRRYFLGAMDASLSSNVSIPMEILVPQVVDLSKGVFLWVKLVAGDLARAANEGLAETDLELLLRSLPAELDDYYIEIIQRTPLSSRWTLYAMLELATRSFKPWEGPAFINAVECSRSSSPSEGMARVAKLRTLKTSDQESHAVRQIKIHSQGLIEIRGRYVELLHQTVQEFVTQPKFKALVLGTEAKVTFENGHSFLGKWMFVDNPGTKYAYDFHQMISHFQLSEKSTGRSMKTFLDSISPKMYTWIDLNCGTRVESSVEFAALANLSLYFRESIQKDQTFLQKYDTNNQKSLISLCLSIPADISSGDRTIRLDVEAGQELAELILDNGYKIHNDPKVFEKVIHHLITSPQTNIQYQKSCIDFIIRLIEYGQDPNVPIIIDESPGGYTIGTALHLGLPEITPPILFHGAKVNHKDSNGMTPLDRLCCNVSTLRGFVIDRRRQPVKTLSDSYQVACMLVDAGGQRACRKMNSSWNKLLVMLSNDGYNIEPLTVVDGPKGWLSRLKRRF
ncbi:hypothetical protein F4805DRAFT_419043 [Annulohypoxylon moriforme]|nr:hypothetical protein F4805DRAFT_419043 [Annulohypoxylon moriforme]